MVSFFGDYDTTETVDIPFNTFTSDDPSASVTITNLAAGDIEIHKDGSTTQRASDAGVTISIDFDTVTGNHMAHIDLSDNTDAGYYANGSRYQVRIEGTTVDGATINAWIGAFSIGCTLRPTTAGNKLDVTATGAAGIDWGNVENKTTANDLSATDIQLCDTVSTLTGHTAQTADHTAGIADIPTVAEFNARSLVAADYTVVADLGVVQTADHTAGIADIPTVAEFNARTLAAADYVVTTDTIAGATTVTTLTGHTAQTGDTFALANGATGFAAIDTVVDAVKAKTDNLPADPASETNVDANETKIDTVDTVVDAIKVVTDALTAAVATKMAISGGTMINGTAATGTLSTTEMTTNLTVTANDQYNGRILIFAIDTTTASLRGQATDITDTVTTDGKLTFTAITTAPANGDTFIIV